MDAITPLAQKRAARTARLLAELQQERERDVKARRRGRGELRREVAQKVKRDPRSRRPLLNHDRFPTHYEVIEQKWLDRGWHLPSDVRLRIAALGILEQRGSLTTAERDRLFGADRERITRRRRRVALKRSAPQATLYFSSSRRYRVIELAHAEKGIAMPDDVDERRNWLERRLQGFRVEDVRCPGHVHPPDPWARRGRTRTVPATELLRTAAGVPDPAAVEPVG